jgi:hypothetical protein
MAYKSFKHLTPRNQSSLVTQLHKLISYYGEIFCPRERVYLKNLVQYDDVIYWLEDEEKKMVAVALMDPNYIFEVSGVKVYILSYLISKRQGQMDRILAHIWSDYEDKTIALLSRKALTAGIDLIGLGLVPFSPVELSKFWPELANQQTDFFNLKKETLSQGMDRKQYYLYLKISYKDLSTLQKNSPALVDAINQKDEAMKQLA